MTDSPALHALEGVRPQAHIEHRRRALTWTLPGPGELYRNCFAQATITIAEREFLQPHSLWVSAERWASETDWQRTPWTDRGREALSIELLPRWRGRPFDRQWRACHQASQRQEATVSALEEAVRRVRWWFVKASLEGRYARGELRLEEHGQDRYDPMVLIADAHGQDHRESALGALRGEDRTQVGWMTTSGAIVPMESILRDAAPAEGRHGDQS